MFVMRYPDNRRGARQVRVAVQHGAKNDAGRPVTERIKIYTSTKVGTARKQPVFVLESPGSSA